MKKMHYGWVICITCTLLLFVTMGTVSNGFSVYLPYIMEEKGLTNAQTSSLVTLRCAVSFLSMLVIGFYYQKVSIRVGTTIAAAAAGVSFLLYSAAEAYPLFCVGAAISGVSYGLGSMIPVSILINRWFYQHRALALSICASGSGIATIVLPPVTTALVENLSMATTFRIEAVAIFLLAAVIFLALRNQPADKGLLPCGQTQAQEAAAQASVNLGPQRVMTRQMWLLLGCASLFMGALANPGFSHLSVLFTSEGFSSATVAPHHQRHRGDDHPGQAGLRGGHRPHRRRPLHLAVRRHPGGGPCAVLPGASPRAWCWRCSPCCFWGWGTPSPPWAPRCGPTTWPRRSSTPRWSGGSR